MHRQYRYPVNERKNYLCQVPETNDECSNSIADPMAAFLHSISITTFDMALNIALVVESGGSPVQRAKILAGIWSTEQRQYI